MHCWSKNEIFKMNLLEENDRLSSWLKAGKDFLSRTKTWKKIWIYITIIKLSTLYQNISLKAWKVNYMEKEKDLWYIHLTKDSHPEYIDIDWLNKSIRKWQKSQQKKWASNLNRYFAKTYPNSQWIHKGCSTSFILRNTQMNFVIVNQQTS